MTNVGSRGIEHSCSHLPFGTVVLLLSLLLMNYTVIYAQTTPQVKVSPEQGKSGVTIMVSGEGFAANTGFSVTFSDNATTRKAGNTDFRGKFTDIVMTVPEWEPGEYQIIVIADTRVSKPFRILPAGAPATDKTAPKPVQTQTPVAPSTSTSLPASGNTTPSKETRSYWSHVGDSLDVGLIALFLGALITVGSWYLITTLTPAYSAKQGDPGYMYGEAQRSLRQYEAEYSKAIEERNRANRELSRLQSDRQKLPQLKIQYNNLRELVRRTVPKTRLGIVEGIDNSPPADEYWAYCERRNALAAVFDNVTKEAETARQMKDECLRLAGVIRQQEPALYDTLRKVTDSSNADGLAAVVPLLEQIARETESREVSAGLQDELTRLEKSIETIRDYSFRLVPSKLIKFSRDLIKTPGSQKENAIREKTVRELMKLVDEYLQL